VNEATVKHRSQEIHSHCCLVGDVVMSLSGTLSSEFHDRWSI